MSRDTNIAVAQALLADIAAGKDPEHIAALFDPELSFEIQGDDGVLPWIGFASGREAAAEFFRDVRALTEPVLFEVEDVLGSEDRAVIVGKLASRIKKTGRVTRSQFAIILTFAGGSVVRFQVIEDSFDVSRAARTD